jgi:predicted DNA-binding transcriptional regulator
MLVRVTNRRDDTAAGSLDESNRLSQGQRVRADDLHAASAGVRYPESRSGEAFEGREIGIMLSPAQIEHVVGAALNSGLPSIAALLTGLHAGHAISRASLEERYRSELGDARLSHSLLRGLLVLSLLIDGSERGVSNIARRLDISISTAHRYVSTLLAFGLVEQNQFTRKYRLAAGLTAEPTQRPGRRSRVR